MIPSSIGATFAPTQDPALKPPASPVESAVKLLSTALPRTFGAPTPVSPQLLAGFGGGVHPDVASAVVRSVLAALFGPSGVPGGLTPTAGGEAGGLSRAASSFGAPNPNFTFTPPRASGPGPQVPREPRLGTVPAPSGPTAPLASNPIAPPPIPSGAGSFGEPMGRSDRGQV